MRLILLLLAICFGVQAQDAFIVDSPVSTTQVTATNANIGKLTVSNVSATGGVSVTGNVSANKFIGDGSLLTGITGGGGGGTGTITSGTAGAMAYYTSTTTLSAAADVTYTAGLLRTPVISATAVYVTGTTGTVSATNGYFRNVSGTFVGDGSGLSNLPAPSWYIIGNIPAQLQRVSDSGYLAASGLGVAGTVTATTVSASTVTATVINGNIASLTALTAGTAYVGTMLEVGSNNPPVPLYGPNVMYFQGTVEYQQLLAFCTVTKLHCATLYASENAADASVPIILGTSTTTALGFGTANQESQLTLATNGGSSIGTYAHGTVWKGSPANGLNMDGNLCVGCVTPTTAVQVSGTISATNITLAPDKGTCSATNKGMMRFGSVSNTIQFCNGTKWLSLSPTLT